MADKDTQLELQKRARRRLVGAAALAVAAAVILPMVMDQEPKPVNQDIQIRIPSQEAGTPTSHPLPGKPGAATPAAPESKPVAPEQSAKAEEAKPVETKPNSSSAPAPATSVAAPIPDNPVEKPVEKPAPKAEQKPAEKPVPKAEVKVAERPQAKNEPKLEARSEATRAQAILEGGGEQFVVQLGVFSEQANVKKIRERIKAEGYNSYTEVLHTPNGAKTRVRAGPFPTREAAEKARSKLKRSGMDGIVASKS